MYFYSLKLLFFFFFCLFFSFFNIAQEANEEIPLDQYNKNGFFFRTSEYWVVNTWVLEPNQSLVGQGRETIIYIDPRANPAVVLNRGSSIRNLTLKGTGASNSVGITTTDGIAFFSLNNITVQGFTENIVLKNSIVGSVRDVISIDGGIGLKIRGTQTSTKFEGYNYFGGNKWGIWIDNNGMAWQTIPHMTLYFSGVVEGNTEGGLYFNANCYNLSIEKSHFEWNGPNHGGPDILFKHGFIHNLSIKNNGFFKSITNIVFETTIAKRGEISNNYIPGDFPLITNKTSVLNIHDNTYWVDYK